MKTIFRLLGLLMILISTLQLKASHLIVGEMNYKSLGNNSYEITLYYYRDCRPPAQGGGNPGAMQSDDPAFISIFNGSTFFSFDSVFSTKNYKLPLNNPNSCENSGTPSCIDVLEFKFIKFLPPSAQAYTILNQRCCMNESIMNIANPGTTGHSFYCKIPPQIQNNSAVFAPVENIKFCAGKSYVINHSATDADGDSLSYGFQLPEVGGDANDPKPIKLGLLPVIKTVNYLPPFSILNPVPGMIIDEKSGMITLNAQLQGTFVANIFCNEWKNGVVINTIRRTYIYTISNCNFEVKSSFVCDTNLQIASSGSICLANCESKTISFKNNSIGGIAYHWDFGVDAMQDDTTNVFEPIFTFPDTGRYQVTLFVHGNNCTDSISQQINIYNDEITADFTTDGNLCTGNSITFNSVCSSLNDSITYWKWNFNRPPLYLSSISSKPVLQTDIAGTYQVVLIAYNSYGCHARTEKTIDLSTVHVQAFSDTVIHCGSTINLFASGADHYLWQIRNNTMSTITPDSTSSVSFWCHETKPEASIIYVKGINNDGCTGTDSVKVNCINQELVFVPTAFSPNGDGRNDQLKILMIGADLIYFKIYNRRGQQVFHTTDAMKGWNGEFNGQSMGLDSYYWVACVENLDGKIKVYKGDVILVR